MEIGKLTNEQLQNLVINRLPKLSDNTVVGAGIGADCAWLRVGDNLMVTSSDPITAAGSQSGTLAVHVSCNDIASTGVRPTGILIVIIAPPSATETDISNIVDQASAEAKKLNVDIVGGHTEVSDSVNTFVVISTAFGVIEKNHPVPFGKAKAGDKLIQTKSCCLEGSFIAAREYREKLQGIDEKYIEEASSYNSLISVVTEGSVAGAIPCSSGQKNPEGFTYSAVNLMHDITEGGVFGAAYEMAHFSNLGVTLYEEKIPITDASKAICEKMGLNPYRLISSGSLLISSSESDRVVEALRENGVDATIIGEFTSIDEGFKYFDENNQVQELLPPEADELYKM